MHAPRMAAISPPGALTLRLTAMIMKDARPMDASQPADAHMSLLFATMEIPAPRTFVLMEPANIHPSPALTTMPVLRMYAILPQDVFSPR